MSLLELFESGVKKYSSRKALCFCKADIVSSLSYTELAAASHKVSDALEERHFKNQVIAVVMSTGINLISSLLGIFKAQNCFYYLNPMDLEAPKRFEYLRNKIKFKYCLTDSEKVVFELEKLADDKANIYKLLETQMFLVEFTNAEIRKLPDDIVYVVTTSGSTGSPKIVYVPNKSIVPNILDVTKSFEQSSEDVVFLSSPLTFDPSYVQMFTTFHTGSCLLVVEDSLKLDSKKLLTCILTHHKVTILQTTPSLVSMFGDDIKNILLSVTTSLRILAFGGEKCPSIATLMRWRGEGNKTRIFNIYGITEVSSWATIHELSLTELGKLDSEVCLGRPMDKTILELKNFNEETQEGELWIGGDERVCLLDDENAFSDAIVMRPSGDIVRKDEFGMLYYVGRTDGMIKRMGKRMHIQEIEKVMMNMQRVICSKSLWTEETLILFVVVSDVEELTTDMPDVFEDTTFSSDVLNHIKSWLPPHYLPTKVFRLNQMPLNNHGKVDKKTLLKLCSDFNDSKKHSDNVHLFLELVFNFLNIPPCSQKYLEKSWIQLGGNSIMALSVDLELRKRFPCAGNLLLDKLLNGTPLKSIIDFLSINTPKCNALLERKRKNSGDSMQRKVKQSKNEQNDLSFNVKIISRSISYISKKDENNFDYVRIKNVWSKIDKDRHQSPINLNFHLSWKFDTGKCVDASPLIVLDQENQVFIGSHSHNFFALDLSLGTCNWKTQLEDRIESSACLSKCTKFIITGCYSGNIYVLERSTGNVHWTFNAQNSIKSSAVIHPENGLVYIGSHDGIIYALDIQNKICQWSNNLHSGALFSSPCISPDGSKIFIGSLGGVLFCIDADSGSVLWNVNLDKPIFSSPAASECHCFVGCVDGYLYAINTSIQQIVWSFKTNGPIFSSPNVFLSENKESLNELILIGSHDKCIYCIESKSGSLFWKKKLDSEIYATPSLLPKLICNLEDSQEVCAVLACSAKGFIYLLDIESGSIVSTFQTSSQIFSSPCVTRNKIIVGCRDNHLYCLELK